MRPRLALLFCVIGTAELFTFNAWSATDKTPKTKVSLTNTLTTEARTNNLNGDDSDDNYKAIIDRFNLKLVRGQLTLSTRLDVMAFYGPPTDEFVDDARPERMTAQYRYKNFKFLAGDFYRQMGRGIMLAIRKVDEAGLDLSLRGGQIQYMGEKHRASLFGAIFNPANLDSISQKFIEDTGDLIAGGHYEFAGFDAFQLGLMSIFTQPEETILPEALISEKGAKDQNFSGGTYLNLPDLTDDLSLYFEADVQQRNIAGAKEPTIGYAAYATADVVASDFIILVESLYLNDWEQRGSRNTALRRRFDFNYAPTLERIDQEVFENIDTLGTRVRIERSLEDIDLLLYVNGMIRINNINKEDANLTQFHGFGGFQYVFEDGASHFYLSGGYREENEPEREIRTLAHAEFDYLHVLDNDLAFHMVSNNEFRTLEENRFERGSTLIGIEKSGTAALTIEIGYDTQDPTEGVSNTFLAAILSWEINETLRLRAIAGTQRGGIKCIAGVCRDFPEFAGAKAELVTRL